ncbi:hypothetical protein [Niveibacterium sp. COAC-50]|uniref:hypothetical protein n=1 Tax=Niveibacterium sp. COAC-50 TaxID=2729384 RepID=UPI0015526E67|nr:hypothetical protein [Niveibacterium sp. COAC-50]
MTRHPTRSVLAVTTQLGLLLCLSIVACGCSAVAEVAYDAGLEREKEKCEREFSMPDRTECISGVQRSERQAAALRGQQ